MLPGPARELRAVTEFSTDARNLDPNVTTTAITLGQWHRIEVHLKKSAHLLEWWLDGILQGRYTDIAFPVQSFGQFTISPTWGGVGGAKTESDYYWYDRVRISGSIAPIASVTVDPASASLEAGQTSSSPPRSTTPRATPCSIA
jgi:hypothetical protein